MTGLTLVSHPLCPYVQRAAIALAEKGVAFDRVTIDLSAKPDWFVAISPMGKVPLLQVAGDDGAAAVLFESAAILEYLEETRPRPLHPADPLDRARARGWIEFGSAVLAGIARFYNAADEAALAAEDAKLAGQFAQIEAALGAGPWFAGARFGLVDAAFGPVFRYFDAFERIGRFAVLDGKPKVARWRAALAARPSVRGAVDADYARRLDAFLAGRGGALARRMAA
ncbi:MAG: glutathione S-transferase family protein [Alphaproteobacteria bacterium]